MDIDIYTTTGESLIHIDLPMDKKVRNFLLEKSHELSNILEKIFKIGFATTPFKCLVLKIMRYIMCIMPLANQFYRAWKTTYTRNRNIIFGIVEEICSEKIENFELGVWIEVFKLLPLLFIFNGYFEQRYLIRLSEDYLKAIFEKSKCMLIASEKIGNIQLTAQVAQFWIKLSQKIFRVDTRSIYEEEE